MAAWVKQGVEVAVALEIGKFQIERAEGEAQIRAALDFNLRVWRSIRQLAAVNADAALLHAAEAVDADWSNPAAIVARNVEQARRLAGRSATHGALKAMLEDWLGHRGREPKAEFGQWLLGRMECCGQPLPVAA